MDSSLTYSTATTFFDEKRDHEARRNRKSRSHSASSSTSSTYSHASYTEKSEDRYSFTLPSCYSPPSTFTQTSTTQYYSSKPLPPLPSTTSEPRVHSVLQKPLPPLPLSLANHVGTYITPNVSRPLSHTGQKQSCADPSAEGGEAWWAQQRLQATREWISEKAISGDEGIRGL